MIDKYEIKYIGSEQVLYLYLDLDSEFSRSEFIKKKDEFIDSVKKFIKEKNILFTGTVIAIVVKGLVVGNLYLNNTEKPNLTLNNTLAISEVIKVPNNVLVSLESVSEEIIDENVVNTDSLDSTYSKGEKVIDVSIPTKKVTSNNDRVSTQTSTRKVSEPEIIDTNTYVNIHRNSGVVTLELEEYIKGVVAAEMPLEFNIEALKAQSIIARTYTYKALARGTKLTDNESTQSYKSDDELRALWGSKYNTYINKVTSAVKDTKGMYLTYNGEYIEAVYHSTSNGKTESAEEVWGNAFAYLKSTSSEYDTTNKSFQMDKFISYSELSSLLNTNINQDSEFNILDRTVGDRVKSISINGTIFNGVNLRNTLKLRSADFSINKTDDGVIFTTKGYGHGVGMSQYGANGMANNGYNYNQILEHYYMGTKLEKK